MSEDNQEQERNHTPDLDLSDIDALDETPENDKSVLDSTAQTVNEAAKSPITIVTSDTSAAQTESSVEVSVVQAEAEARIAEAEARARVASAKAEADIKAAQKIAKSKVAEEKQKRRSKTIGRVKRKITVRFALIIGVIIVVIAIGGFATWQLTRPSEFINSSQLTKIVAVNKLAVVDFSYEGIAEYKGDGNEENPLHIHYIANIKATFNPRDIKYEIDNEAKTVTPILPDISISNPNIDDRIDILEGDAQNIDMASVYNACEEDAIAEVESKSNIKDIAISNAHRAVEGLTKNLLDAKGYEIKWPEGTENTLQEGEGDSNAA